MKALTLAGVALAVLASYKVAADGFALEAGVDPRGLTLGSYAQAAPAQ